MARQLDQAESVSILKHYEIDVAEGHSRAGTTMLISGGPTPNTEHAISATIGAHSAHRISPVTDFLAEGLIDELGDSHLKGRPLGRALAHLIVKLSRMQVESVLVAFSLSVLIEGDHYEVLPKSIAIEASHNTTIPHRLTPHAHDRGNLHSARPSHR
jgi:hypothetical protein